MTTNPVPPEERAAAIAAMNESFGAPPARGPAAVPFPEPIPATVPDLALIGKRTSFPNLDFLDKKYSVEQLPYEHTEDFTVDLSNVRPLAKAIVEYANVTTPLVMNHNTFSTCCAQLAYCKVINSRLAGGQSVPDGCEPILAAFKEITQLPTPLAAYINSVGITEQDGTTYYPDAPLQIAHDHVKDKEYYSLGAYNYTTSIPVCGLTYAKSFGLPTEHLDGQALDKESPSNFDFEKINRRRTPFTQAIKWNKDNFVKFKSMLAALEPFMEQLPVDWTRGNPTCLTSVTIEDNFSVLKYSRTNKPPSLLFALSCAFRKRSRVVASLENLCHEFTCDIPLDSKIIFRHDMPDVATALVTKFSRRPPPEKIEMDRAPTPPTPATADVPPATVASPIPTTAYSQFAYTERDMLAAFM